MALAPIRPYPPRPEPLSSNRIPNWRHRYVVQSYRGGLFCWETTHADCRSLDVELEAIGRLGRKVRVFEMTRRPDHGPPPPPPWRETRWHSIYVKPLDELTTLK